MHVHVIHQYTWKVIRVIIFHNKLQHISLKAIQRWITHILYITLTVQIKDKIIHTDSLTSSFYICLPFRTVLALTGHLPIRVSKNR